MFLVSYNFLINFILFKIGLKLDKISLRDVIRHWIKLGNSTIPHFAITFDSMREINEKFIVFPTLAD